MWNPLRLLMRRRRPEEDFSDEIRAHLALEADRLAAEGLAPDDALLEARRRFGNVGLARDAFRRRRTIPLIETAFQHARRAARRLARAPVFSATVALTLMLGIGATTAVFSLVNAVLIEPLPFVNPDGLVDLSHTLVITGVAHVDQSDATYLYYRDANHVFSAVAAYRVQSINLGDWPRPGSDRGPPIRAVATRVTAGTFAMLGITPLAGRVFTDAEDRPGVTPLVVLGERLWRRRYAGDHGVIGSMIPIDGVPHMVAGVMPGRFAFPDERAELWIPLQLDASKTESSTFDVKAVARLRDGVTPVAAEADLQALLPHVPETFPGRLTATAIERTKMRALVRPLRDVMFGDVGRTLWVVLGAAAFLLIVACANVANLFLVRAESRQHDLAVRSALGAGRGTIVAEFLAEGLMLAAIGGGLGLVLAAAGVRVLRSLESAIAIPRLATVGIDGRALALAGGVTLLAALVMSIVPALRHGAADASMLALAGRATTAGRSRHRARRAFVVAQMALALVLVAGAGLMARSFAQLRSVSLGFDPAGASVYRLALPAGLYPRTADITSLVGRTLEAVAALPGVAAAGVVTKLPLDDEARRDTAVFLEASPLGMGAMPNIHQVNYATPDAFAALGIPIVLGRTFDAPDPARAPLDVIVTRALAARYWRGSDALGKRLRLSPRGPLFTVIGVTGEVRGTRLEQPPDETVFLPLVTAPGIATPDGGESGARWSPREIAIVVRASGGVDVSAEVERTLRAMAPMTPSYGARPLADIVARAASRTSFTLELLGIASLAALMIGAVGLYGVVSYMVTLRTRELAVRIALGAQPSALRRSVLGQAVAVASAGIAIGLAGTVVLMRSVRSLLYGVAPTDPATLIGAVLLMCAVTVIASWMPARRAASADPADALRADT